MASTEWHACQDPDLDLKIFPPEPLPERLFSAKISRALFGLVRDFRAKDALG